MADKNRTFQILVVDDNQGDLTLLQEAIKEGKFPIAVTVCTSAMDALNVLSDGRRFDCVLSDLNMPIMNGVDLVRHMGRFAELKQTAVVLMSSSRKEKLPARLTAALAELGVPYFTKATTWSDFVRLANEIYVMLISDRSEKSGRMLAERMTPPHGYAKPS